MLYAQHPALFGGLHPELCDRARLPDQVFAK